jgi:flagellar biosynthesis/type III secretory pathway protein FliH
MAGNAHERMIELLDEAGQTYFNAMRTGLQIQEDVSKWWSEQARSAEMPAGMGGDPEQAMGEAFKQWQANAERALQMMEQRTQQSIELLNKAFAVGQADSIEAAQKKLNELWESSLKSMRENVQATLKANEQIAEAMMQMARKQSGKSGKAASAKS